MSFPSPVATGTVTDTDVITVGAASVQFANIVAMAAGQRYLFCSSTACWIKQAANPTASAAAGSMYVPANTQIVIAGEIGAKLAAIQDAVGGKASLTRVKVVR